MDIETYGLYFQFDSNNLNRANYKHKTRIARSLSVYAGKFCTALYSYFKIDKDTLGELGKDNSNAPYCQFKRLLFFICQQPVYFGVYFLPNQAHRHQYIMVLTSKSAF